jgi:hypothetical protein
MKAVKDNQGETILTKSEGIEILSITEMFHIRGGYSEDKSKSKDVDIYDQKEN